MNEVSAEGYNATYFLLRKGPWSRLRLHRSPCMQVRTMYFLQGRQSLNPLCRANVVYSSLYPLTMLEKMWQRLLLSNEMSTGTDLNCVAPLDHQCQTLLLTVT